MTCRVGRPDLVGTDPQYRRRGLIRAQFEVVHQWSARREHVLKAMPSIPSFYHRLGYDLAETPSVVRYFSTMGEE